MADHKDYLPLIFRRCVLAILGARIPPNTTFEEGMLEQLVLLAETHLLELTNHLHRIAAIQRRKKPSINDLALMFFMNEINVVDLDVEAHKYTPQMEDSLPVATLNALHFDPEEAPLESSALPFFQHHKQLAPSHRHAPPSIPAWMPPLPPDHTYMHTPSHSSSVRDLRHVRLQLVEEGRLAERALQRMLGDKGSASVMELKKPAKHTQSNRTLSAQPNGQPNGQPINGSASGQPNVQPNGPVSGSASGLINGSANEQPLSGSANGPSAGGRSEPTPEAQPPVKIEIKREIEELETESAEQQAAAAVTVIDPTPKPAEPERPKLRFKFHAPPPPQTETPPAPKLKLSLAKPKKRKEVSVLGKRPRVDLVSLAKAGKKDNRENSPMEVEEKDSFQQALASVHNLQT